MKNNNAPSYNEFRKATLEALKGYKRFGKFYKVEDIEEDIKFEYKSATQSLESGRITVEQFLNYEPKSAAHEIDMCY
ncbi:hypothetical protein KQI68_06595 [Peptoniphilus sp. MSJ-1]|uniref:Uncharacterized protein n=1 Tax=Peptoniphilus ovalis TaxID=2841503 RepID=A0ABS6FHQ9_9FIRM|nr:hypothetical protein [Peptoniphilus ovalis]MBU5669506.1 hypothetical protein [Peptoniphilus ovalis]